jgi:glycerophosphoryl diester phosphodiesterase
MSRSFLGRALLAGAALLVVSAPAASAAQDPAIWAHRGGSYVNGKATYPENTLPAFAAAAKARFALELDVQLTSDGVPIVIHDDTLDRTTPCTGPVSARTYADIRDNCRSDVLGSPEGPLGKKAKKTSKTVALPTFAQVLALAKKTKSVIAPESKSFDPNGTLAAGMVKDIKASGIPLKNVIVQSFFNQNLDKIRALLPSVKISQLTIGADQAGKFDLATTEKATYISPQLTSEIDASWASDAHQRKLLIAPYTLDTKSEVKRAKKIGVDAVITDDPYMAAKALGAKKK